MWSARSHTNPSDWKESIRIKKQKPKKLCKPLVQSWEKLHLHVILTYTEDSQVFIAKGIWRPQICGWTAQIQKGNLVWNPKPTKKARVCTLHPINAQLSLTDFSSFPILLFLLLLSTHLSAPPSLCVVPPQSQPLHIPEPFILLCALPSLHFHLSLTLLNYFAICSLSHYLFPPFLQIFLPFFPFPF